MTTEEEIQEIAQELRGRSTRKSEFEAAQSPVIDKFESEAYRIRAALTRMEALWKELNSAVSKERERNCLSLASSLLQTNIAPKWPQSGPEKWQIQFETTKAQLADKLAEQMRSETGSPRLIARLGNLLRRF
jgi:hypothetical protein